MSAIKFQQGIYLADTVSHSKPAEVRHAIRMERYDYMARSPIGKRIDGWWPRMTWTELDESRDNFEEILDVAEEGDRGVSLQIVDRRFGDESIEPPIPDKAKNLGTWSEDGMHFGAVWTPEYVDLQLELIAKLSKFDDHPAFVQVHWGESSIPHKTSNQKYTNELIRLMLESKRMLPTTQVGTKVNFLGDSDDLSYLRQIFVAAKETKGCFITNPDSVLQRRSDYEGDNPLDYTIKCYELFEEFKNDVITSPRVETWDTWKKDTLATIQMVIEKFGANHVCLQPSFDSRRDENLYYPAYFDEYIVPAIEQLTVEEYGKMATLPFNMRPSVTKPNLTIVKPTNIATTEATEMTTMPKYKGLEGYPLVRPSDYQVSEYIEAGREVPENFFGYKFRTIARNEVPNETYPSSKYPVIRSHKYSTHQPWSHDGRYFLTYEGSDKGRSFIIDGYSGLFMNVLRHGLTAAMWLPNLIDDKYYIVGICLTTRKPTKVELHSGKRTIINTADLSDYTAGNAEGHINEQGKVLYTHVYGDDVRGCIVDFNKGTTNLIQLIGIADGFDTATLSHSGKYIVAMTTKKGTVQFTLDKTVSYTLLPHQLTTSKHHGLMTVDETNRDIFVQIGYIINGARYVVAWDLATGDMTILLGGEGKFTNNHAAQNMSLTGHVGHAHRGSVFISMIDPEGPHICGFLKTDGSQDFTPVAYTYDTDEGYYSQAHGVASPNGRRAAIAGFRDGVRISTIINTLPAIAASMVASVAIAESIPTLTEVVEQVVETPTVSTDESVSPVAKYEAMQASIRDVIVAMGHFADAVDDMIQGSDDES